jgi:capsular exopolysaccharide synthesis family protein
MRKPKIHSLFNISNKKGLSTFLIKKDNIDDIVVNSKVKNLTIIPSGPTPPNPSELIGNGSFEKLIQKAKEYFDYIIVDNAPAAIVADGAMTSEHTDINLFVVRSDYTTRDNIKQIDQIREQGLIDNLSIIINDLKKGRSGYHYYAKKGYGFYAELKSNKIDKNLTLETQ